MKPDGEHIGSIRGPWMVNMAWGEDDWSTLYFTGRNSLNKIKLNIPGIPVPRGAL
jgi:gluconolactonase